MSMGSSVPSTHNCTKGYWKCVGVEMIFSDIISTMKQSSCFQPDTRYQHYVSVLTQHGLQVSPKLQLTFFNLKNGLQYPGVGTTEDIDRNEILIRVPTELLLTAHRARTDPPLKEVFDHEFYRSSENRILVTYLLYCMSQQGGVWYQMGHHLPKDIDIISFWPEQELQLFGDESVRRAAKLERSNFQAEWKKFTSLQLQYPILTHPIYNYQSYKCVYIHTITRCFGSCMGSSYFTPYVQFINHSCVDVSYTCVTDPCCTLPQRKQSTQSHKSHKQEDIGSVSSDNSEDYIQNDDFDYMAVESYSIKWGSKICFDLNHKQTKQVEEKVKEVEEVLERDLYWFGISLVYIGEIMQMCNIIKNQYMAGRKPYQLAVDELGYLLYHVCGFKKAVKEFYHGQSQHYGKKKKQHKKQQQQQIKPPSHDYKEFRMMSYESEFKSGQELFFCYGRLSNRTLLLRYGFCLQNNKYEHVWIRVKMNKQIGQYPDLFERVQEKGLPITYKIKLKAHVLNTELITLFRMRKWKMYSIQPSQCKDMQEIFHITDLEHECSCLEQTLAIYKQQLLKHGQVTDLTDEQKGYHEYFAGVYNNEKISIIQVQIHLCEQLLALFEKMVVQKAKVRNYREWWGQMLSQRDQKKVQHYVGCLDSYI